MDERMSDHQPATAEALPMQRNGWQWKRLQYGSIAAGTVATAATIFAILSPQTEQERSAHWRQWNKAHSVLPEKELHAQAPGSMESVDPDRSGIFMKPVQGRNNQEERQEQTADTTSP